MLLCKWQVFPIVAQKAQSQSIKDFIKLWQLYGGGGEDDKKKNLIIQVQQKLNTENNLVFAAIIIV